MTLTELQERVLKQILTNQNAILLALDVMLHKQGGQIDTRQTLARTVTATYKILDELAAAKKED